MGLSSQKIEKKDFLGNPHAHIGQIDEKSDRDG